MKRKREETLKIEEIDLLFADDKYEITIQYFLELIQRPFKTDKILNKFKEQVKDNWDTDAQDKAMVFFQTIIDHKTIFNIPNLKIKFDCNLKKLSDKILQNKDLFVKDINDCFDKINKDEVIEYNEVKSLITNDQLDDKAFKIPTIVANNSKHKQVDVVQNYKKLILSSEVVQKVVFENAFDVEQFAKHIIDIVKQFASDLSSEKALFFIENIAYNEFHLKKFIILDNTNSLMINLEQKYIEQEESTTSPNIKQNYNLEELQNIISSSKLIQDAVAKYKLNINDFAQKIIGLVREYTDESNFQQDKFYIETIVAEEDDIETIINLDRIKVMRLMNDIHYLYEDTDPEDVTQTDLKVLISESLIVKDYISAFNLNIGDIQLNIINTLEAKTKDSDKILYFIKNIINNPNYAETFILSYNDQEMILDILNILDNNYNKIAHPQNVSRKLNFDAEQAEKSDDLSKYCLQEDYQEKSVITQNNGTNSNNSNLQSQIPTSGQSEDQDLQEAIMLSLAASMEEIKADKSVMGEHIDYNM